MKKLRNKTSKALFLMTILFMTTFVTSNGSVKAKSAEMELMMMIHNQNNEIRKEVMELSYHIKSLEKEIKELRKINNSKK